MSYKRIVVIQTAYLGDLIMTTPLFRELKLAFPGVEVDAVVIPETAGIIKNNPHIDRVYLFDKRRKRVKLLSFLRLVRDLRKRRYDAAYSMTKSMTSSLIMLLSGIPERVGQEGMRFLTRSIRTKDRPHIRERAVELLTASSGYDAADASTELFPGPDKTMKAKEMLAKSTARINIGFAPGSVRETKKWPGEYFSELLDLLAGADINIYFIGSADDRLICRRIIEGSSNRNCHNLAGELGLPLSAAVIGLLDLMVTNDSAPLHMSNAVDTPVLAFFGPTVKEYGCYPYRDDDRMLEVDLDCRPCGTHGGKACPLGHHDCMRAIRPETVYKEIMRCIDANQD